MDGNASLSPIASIPSPNGAAAPQPAGPSGAFSSPGKISTAVEKKAVEFETVMLAQMLKPMFESVETPSLFGGKGATQDAFRGLLHEEYAKAISASGGVGIADSVQQALIRIQSENS